MKNEQAILIPSFTVGVKFAFVKDILPSALIARVANLVAKLITFTTNFFCPFMRQSFGSF